MSDPIAWKITSQVSCTMSDELMRLKKAAHSLGIDMENEEALEITLAAFKFEEAAGITPEERRRIILELEDVQIGEDR